MNPVAADQAEIKTPLLTEVEAFFLGNWSGVFNV
jgi:hypothetical protein